MCLYIGNKKGHIAKHDIICYKRLNKTSRGDYLTPCRDWPVKLNSTLVPEQKQPEFEDCGYKWSINGGVIHAYLDPRGGDGKCIFKAIIPKGTRFWIQEDMCQVAAEKLELTSEQLEEDSIKFDYSVFIEYAADVRLKDGTRASMSESILADDVEGIYAYDEQCIAPKFLRTKFSNDKLYGYPDKEKVSFDKFEQAKKHLGGKRLSEILEKNCSSSELYALDFCRDNGGYLPSEGELIKAFENLESINITMKILGLDPFPYAWYWSSSIYNSEGVWGVGSDGYWGYWGCLDYGWGAYYVVPFLSSFEN